MTSITVTTTIDADATNRHSLTTEVIENRHVYLEDTGNASSATFNEWENVPASLQDEMASVYRGSTERRLSLKG